MRCHTYMSWFVLMLCSPLIWALGETGDWAHWRGPELDGSSAETNLPEAWSVDGKNLIWKAPFGSRSTPLVLNNRVYMINKAGEDEKTQERVLALDINTGQLIWEYRFNVFLTDIVAHRVGWASLAGDPETGNIYAHGVQGLFYCFDKDGKILWSHSLTESFGRISGYGGRTNTPVVDGDLVFISFLNSSWGPHAKPVHRFLAMNKYSGEIEWWSSPSGPPLDTTYSVPVLATVNGVRMLFSGLADGGVCALQAATGEPVWSFQLSKRGINASVVYHDGLIYASHSEENMDTSVMGRLVCIDAKGSGDITQSGEVWRIDGLGAGYASPAYHDGMLFVADNSANLHCIDAKTGKTFWVFNYGTAARGSALYADGKIFIGEMTGKYHILKVSKEKCERLHEIEFSAENGSPVEVFSSPVAAHGRVFLATKDALYCIGLDKKAVKATHDHHAEKTAKATPGKAAQLLVVPGETMIAPGGSQTYTAKLFDDKGNFIKEAEAAWSSAGVKGAMKGNSFAAAADNRLSAGTVTAEAEGLKSSARLRVVPELPYTEDFENLPVGSTPAGWITSPSKSQVMEMDGKKVLKKLADRSHPAFARMRAYLLPPLEPGYTIQADMMGQVKKRRFVPDMGLVNCRYMLMLVGTTKERVLRVNTWDPMPRLQKDVPYDWQPDTWYTVKMSYGIENGLGMVRGKVWPQGEAEPADWNIELSDPVPNTGGSPALYGYSVAISEKSPGTEIYYDNIIVSKNK